MASDDDDKRSDPSRHKHRKRHRHSTPETTESDRRKRKHKSKRSRDHDRSRERLSRSRSRESESKRRYGPFDKEEEHRHRHRNKTIKKRASYSDSNSDSEKFKHGSDGNISSRSRARPNDFEYDDRKKDKRDPGNSRDCENDSRESSPNVKRKTERKHGQEDNDSELSDPNSETPDYDVQWENYRYTLNRIFFRDEDLIHRGTQQYDDFWDFLKKYLAFRRKKAEKGAKIRPTTSRSHSGKNTLKIPPKYDGRYRINVALPPRDIANCLREDRHRRGVVPLTEKMVEQFKQIYLHYLDFLQKQKFAKLIKIRRDQENLPIYQFKQNIIDTVREHQVVLVAGDTGCGKSTQVPQYLLEGGFQQIACTQPRRLACIALAKRVSHETLNEYGSQVAYQVRFEKTKTQITRILFLTEGLLLRQMSNDPLMEKYNVIIIDEVHERHIHTDFLLGVMKCLLQQRPDLKVILMSATINIDLFSGYFDQAPVINVPGRLYPIELHYLPISEDAMGGKTQRVDPRPYIRVLQRIENKYPSSERGDVLMFLSGLTEIMTIVEAIQTYAQQTRRWIVLPLHSTLSVVEQDKVFDFPPDGVRKCIVSTNIAETSVTIDGVRFVVDSGKVKEMNYDSKCKMQKLQEFWISRASSEQRKGRAGRTGPGVCYRLYDESEYNDLQPYSTPEIQRVPLDSLVLQMVAMGLQDARRFPFIEPPPPAALEMSIGFLIEQSALTNEEVLTPIGEMLSQLPVDVVIGKMLIMGSLFHMIEPILSVSSALSVQSPFTARAHSDNEAMNARKPLESDHGDPFTLLNAFNEWVQIKAQDRNSDKKWCRRRGLEGQRFYDMTRLKTQFHEILYEHGLVSKGREVKAPAVTRLDRQKEHAEKRKLRELKRDQQKTRNKKKFLKLDDYRISGDEGEDEGDDLDANIRDLEFRLMYDLDSLQDASNESKGYTLRQITLLKIILCSGLYPQVALADDSSSTKSDMMFHTRSKPFVTIHPTSIFAVKGEVLELSDTDTRPAPGGVTSQDSRYPYSNKHQLLAYVSLLETTKPYLMGVMRVPAIQTLALYATNIDTNGDCTKMVFDGWLEVRFGSGEDASSTGEMVISSAVQLRTTWQLLVQAKLEAHKAEEEEESTTLKKRVSRLEQTLASKLTEFLYSDIVYSIRRLLAADLVHIYVGPSEVDENSSTGKVFAGLRKDSVPHPVKGGLRITDFLTYNCLQDSEDSYTSFMQRHWTCPKCGDTMVVTVMERIQHEQQCTLNEQVTDKKDDPGEGSKGAIHDGKDRLRKSYKCDSCGEEFLLTPTEFLKHKRQCSASSAQNA